MAVASSYRMESATSAFQNQGGVDVKVGDSPSSSTPRCCNGTGETGLVPDYIMPYIYTINLAIMCGLCSIFGIITNIINITVFVRQGFKETINISLLGLAVSDLCSLLALLFVSICYNPFFMYSDLPVLTIELQHYVGGWTHVIFTRITGFITVFITLERCLCIAYPLRVKNMLTPKRVTAVIIAIYVVVFGSMGKHFIGFSLGWKYVSRLNRTVLGNIYGEKISIIEHISLAIQLLYPPLTFIPVICFSGIIIWKLNQRGKWRLAAVSTDQENKAAIRDRQVVKMVVYIAVIFIVSFTPSLVLFIVMVALPDSNLGLKNENLFILSYSFSFTFEAINSSVNIFVYYGTSSKYKKVFQSLFPQQVSDVQKVKK